MSLEKGTRLGPYEIQSAIGAGGMGEVYLANDTRLNRRVAIKILPPQWSSNPDMKARFDREAQIIAGLSHPHICTLHDIGHEGATDYLVMEYLEGQTLAERIAKGVLSVEEAVPIAAEIADALDRAHREGITHRDLKPGNVMLTKSGVKLLDFGLAKQGEPVQTAASSQSVMPTRAEITMQGAIVGTMQYMAPEQLEGKDVTPQTDIFAFGAVLYEMLTGKKAFASDSQAGLISAIMTAAPPSISATQKIDLPALEFAVRKCLQKDPANRWQSARDLMDHLRWSVQVIAPTVATAAPAPARTLTPAVAVVIVASLFAAIIVTALAVRHFLSSPAAEEFRFSLDAEVAGQNFAVSPNGRWVAFAGRSAGETQRFLFVRPMSSTKPQKIAGTEDALAPFWSADSDRIGFFSGPSLESIALAGGTPEKICDAPGTNRTGAWNRDGIIIFSSNNVLNRVSAAGGKPEPITSLNSSRAETIHLLPSFLPDGQHYLFTASSQQIADRAVYAGTLGSPSLTRVLSLRTQALYASGQLLYVDNAALVARPFDAGKLAFTGEPVRIVDQVEPSFSVSNTGVLAYRDALPAVAIAYQFSWMDRSGKSLGNVGGPERDLPYWDLSADGKQVAVSRIEAQTGNVDIWVVDLERGISSRVTTDPGPEANPRWSPDGLHLAYVTQKKGNRDVFEKAASGLGEETELLNSKEPETLDDWSPDGKYILYRTGALTSTIYALPLFGDRKPIKVIESEFNKGGSRLSPDGKWMTYQGLESGSWQVYVVSFPKPDQKRQVSTEGGVQPRWSGDGRELYFLNTEGKMMAVDITTQPTLSSGAARVLFDTGMRNSASDGIQYAVTGDGKRFLLFKEIPPDPTAPPPMPRPLSVIVNWMGALQNRKP